MEKEIQVFPFVGNNTEINKRNRKAKAYSERVSLRKAKQKRKIKSDLIATLIMLICVIAMTSGVLIKAFTEPNSYYKRTETKQPNGQYYIYVTERICEVVEINNDLITVEYKGNLYEFYGYGYEVGQKIICQFTNGMEIVGVTE